MARIPMPICRVLSLLVLSAVALGCQSDSNEDLTDDLLNEYNQIYDKSGGGPPMKPIVGQGEATITGTVRVVGNRPTPSSIDFTKDREVCLCKEAKDRGDDAPYNWVIDAGGGLKNVVVFVKPLDENKEFFKLDGSVLLDKLVKDKLIKKQVVIDQPYCAYDPHVSVLFNQYVDPENPGESRSYSSYKLTGQKFEITSGRTIGHNIKFEGYYSAGIFTNVGISPGDRKEYAQMIKPYYSGPYNLSCTVHPWMKAFFWSFPHPYAAVTSADGKFTIKGVPAGARIRLVAWHEEAGWLLGGPDGIEITLKDKETLERNIDVRN